MTKRTNNILWSIGVVLVLGWCGMSLAASPPERINFQGVLRDASGAPVADGTYDMVFRFYNRPGACDCGQDNTPIPGCSDATCEADVCAIDSFCCTDEWDGICAAEAGTFASCQACIADEDVLRDTHGGAASVAVAGGLFNVALGSGVLADGSGAGTYGSLGEVFRDFDVVYVEPEVSGEVLSPRIRVEGSAYTQNALQLEGKRAAEFLDTSATLQTKAGDLTVGGTLTGNGSGLTNLDADLLDGKDSTEFLDTSATLQTKAGDLTVGGNLTLTGGGLEFPDGSVQTSAVISLPPDTCFDNVGRFVDCGDGAVKDNLTGLFWLENAMCFFGTSTWSSASIAAAQLGDGQCGLMDGSSPGDWRLPTDVEWQVIIDQATANGCGAAPLVPNTLGTGCWSEGDPFAGVQSDGYWSSATNATNPLDAWVGNLINGIPLSLSKTNPNGFVWPVRAGP